MEPGPYWVESNAVIRHASASLLQPLLAHGCSGLPSLCSRGLTFFVVPEHFPVSCPLGGRTRTTFVCPNGCDIPQRALRNERGIRNRCHSSRLLRLRAILVCHEY